MKFKSGESLFSEGDPFRGVYYITEGMARILRNSNRKKIVVWFADKGDFIGVSSLFSESPVYTYSAISHDSICRALFISEKEFRQLLAEYPELKEELIKIICARIAYTEERIVNFKKESLKKRFLETLLFFGKKELMKTNAPHIRFSLPDLSEIVGSNRQNIRKILQELQNQHLLTIEKETIIIRDMPRLERIVAAS